MDQRSDPFGVAVSADFNGDGCADLAVSQVAQTVDGVDFAGQVWVFYGSPAGLTGPPDIISVTNVAGQTPISLDRFGLALAAGDVNHDGLADLVVGASYRNGGRGQVFIFPGNRLTAVGALGGRVFAEGDGIVPRPATPSVGPSRWATSTTTAGRMWRSATRARTTRRAR
jgi:hypothetical protein